MTWQRLPIRLAVPTLLGGLLALTGCMPSRLSSGPLLPGLSAGSEAQKDELPPDEAARACFAAARNLDTAGNDVGAIGEYERVLQKDPGNVPAMRRLAVLYDRQCKYDKADSYYRKVVEAAPRDAEVYADWGYSYYLRTKWDEAEKRLRRALELQPGHPRALANLGMVLGQQGHYDEALEKFRAAGVSEADAHCNLAFVYWSQGRLLDARRECQAARQYDGTCANAGAILAQLDRPARPAVACSDRSSWQPRPAPPEGSSGVQTVAGLGTPLPADLAADPRQAAEQIWGSGPRPAYVSPNGTAWFPVNSAPATPQATAAWTPARGTESLAPASCASNGQSNGPSYP
jgi:Flp pilus assembly protein TadD